MKVEFKINMAQIMALVNAMACYEGDQYVSVSRQSYGYYSDVQGTERHGYFSHPLALRNSSGNTVTLEGSTLAYAGSRNAPWAGSNAIAHCLKAAGVIANNKVVDEYRHVLPMASKMPYEEWWRRSYYNVNTKATISNYSVGADAPPLPHDEMPDEEYRAI